MFNKTINISLILALIVVILGAYTRLADAGLGCPDWPGCYGELLVPDVISSEYERPLDVAKAWKEMVHRYAASILGLSILVIFLLAVFRKTEREQSIKLPTALLLLVGFQGALGMWTVTEQVHPGIVTMHLFGGFSTTTLLFWLFLNQRSQAKIGQPVLKRHKLMLIIVTALLIFQIFLGGWTSTNYAALSCGEYFPTCLGEMWPEDMDFKNAYYWGELGVDYEFGILENQTRTAIQMVHRVGAIVVTVAILSLCFVLENYPTLRRNIIVVLGLLSAQVALGIINVVMSLPMFAAVMHNAVALFLLLSLISLAHRMFNQNTA
ncbi:COX15/CtaA family protein [Candidatus Thioglobus sp.]|jgi:cytochrome c oxidase assembly protein subunit 15|nr:COX15/CtaA family protein [Candidatus Thioglobus sp.]MDA9058081.1 COX15/CtaA family protein [Candidatus Thioglobus sp.]MDA9060198.1 COX15/CtaA family protein [Candidatus Thioglobus sp.]MDB4026413.1 COX15/CtaA family protein [Candidatus Thioglobus sp.]MDB9950776.1 COX15/CtaA family protein [Candidatus Thioglobus sp.]